MNNKEAFWHGSSILKLLFLIFLLILSSCSGPDGNAYQKYWWAGSLGYIYDTNPSTPATIYNDVYFKTSSGSYYMEYQAFDGSYWYMYYTITAETGGLFFKSGEDTWFELGLYSTGPALYKWDTARIVKDDEASYIDEKTSVSTSKVNQKISTGKFLSKVLGKDELITDFGSIRIKYGKIIEK